MRTVTPPLTRNRTDKHHSKDVFSTSLKHLVFYIKKGNGNNKKNLYSINQEKNIKEKDMNVGAKGKTPQSGEFRRIWCCFLLL